MADIVPNHPQHSALVTFTNFNPVKLTRDNYPFWLPQIVPHLRGGNLFGYVDGTFPQPEPNIEVTNADGVTTTSLNPAYLHWTMQDQLILGAITSALSENMISHVARCKTSRSAWTTLETLFVSRSRARTMQVRYQLATLKKGNTSIADYYQKFQSLADSLAAVDQPLNESESASFLLARLGPEFDPFVTSATTRVEPLSVEELYGHLLSHELRLEQHNSVLDLSVAGTNYAARGSFHRGSKGGRGSSSANHPSGRGFNPSFSKTTRGRGRGPYANSSRGSYQNSASSSCPVCQLCNRIGHKAFDCYNRFNEAFSRESLDQPHAYYSAPSQTTGLSWYPDSGATHHLTSDLQNLNIKAEEFTGSEQIKIGNGKGLSIHHIGQTRLSSPPFQFDLFNVLHVPKISKNLLSGHRFTKDTDTFFEFHPSYFLLKDRRSKKVLLRGPNSHGLYQFPFSANKSPPSALVGERVSFPQWHSRLGHPAFKVVRRVLSFFKLPVSSNKDLVPCSACLSSKAKQFPFSPSSFIAICPLELVYTDVWGPAPICSRSSSRYYVSFLDAFSRYTWLYPISCKSDVTNVFIKFRNNVECFFNSKIRAVQSDWGGEYRPLNKLLQTLGINHRVSCPHTHQQNGAIERKHRHIVETGLALFSHAHMPLQFWDDAFSTACYLINRMPTPLLKNQTPYEKLFKCAPDYHFLHTFGCACWPNLRPYNSNKLQPRSTQCLFLGYSPLHKGYKCLQLSTNKLYISRDVIFNENIFPFTTEKSSGIFSPTVQSIAVPSSLSIPRLHDYLPEAVASSSSSTSRDNETSSLLPTLAASPSQSDPATSNTPHSPSSSPLLSPMHPSVAASPTSSHTPHLMITRAKNNITKPKKFHDGIIRYPLPKALIAESTP
jgi:hypothetical protein